MSTALQLLIVDDEELARRLMREYLRKHSDITIIGECDNGIAAVDALQSQPIDLVLLDIHMPKLNGLEVLELTGRTSGVIFTTAYDQYALKAFDHHAVDYLLKPFSQQRFDEAIEKARKLLPNTDDQRLKNLITQPSKPLERLVVKDRGHIHIIPTAEIDYVEAQDDYISIHAGAKAIMKTQSLSELEKQLDPSQFIRIHRSFIVKLSAVKFLERVSKDSQVAVLHNGMKLPISRAGLERIRGLVTAS